MESPEFVQSKLVNYTTAFESVQQVENNRYHYKLFFDEAIGWDWLYGEVKKASRSMGVTLELWKIRPAMNKGVFEVEVREVDRRPDIDDDQIGLSEFDR